jgi:hypothetical protein
VQRAARYVFGVLVVGTMVSSTVPPTASAQGAKPDACRYMDAAQMLQLTGRKDSLGTGPQKQDPSDIPNHTSGCHFLEVLLVLDTPFTAEQFARARASIEKRYKSQSVSGVGDEAYVTWDPRPGIVRSVHLSFRAGNKRISIEDLVPPDSIETAKKWLIAFGKTAASRAK